MSSSRAFQTLIKQSYGGSSWSDTDEQLDYTFDAGGRLRYASFAQTKDTDVSPEYVANERATAAYQYDAAGRTTQVYHTWDNLTGYNSTTHIPTFSSSPIANSGFMYDYDSTTGLKTDAVFKTASGGSWVTDHTETYGYDSQLDYLTSADYGDGGGSHTWGYDAAGNRTSTSEVSGSWVYNDLNEMTSSPNITGISGGTTSVGYTYDYLGNRVTRNQVTGGDDKAGAYKWDALNRMIEVGYHTNGYKAAYRADGQRIEKLDGYYFVWLGLGIGGSGIYTWGGSMMHDCHYYYDGQMGMEDDDNWTVSGTAHQTIDRYGLGARGIDYLEYTDTNNSAHNSVGFPIYDGHGNMVMTLARSGSTYSTGNQRAYDAWGLIRTGTTSGLPNQRYCANLGHTVDDETGLIYMRARYYEPQSGRFVSEDQSREGWNWYLYCSSDPVNLSDETGRADHATNARQYYWMVRMALVAEVAALVAIAVLDASTRAYVVSALAFGALWVGMDIGLMRPNPDADLDFAQKILIGGTLTISLAVASGGLFNEAFNLQAKAGSILMAMADFLMIFMTVEAMIEGLT